MLQHVGSDLRVNPLSPRTRVFFNLRTSPTWLAHVFYALAARLGAAQIFELARSMRARQLFLGLGAQKRHEANSILFLVRTVHHVDMIYLQFQENRARNKLFTRLSSGA